jgi:hypothetical protein
MATSSTPWWTRSHLALTLRSDLLWWASVTSMWSRNLSPVETSADPLPSMTIETSTSVSAVDLLNEPCLLEASNSSRPTAPRLSNFPSATGSGLRLVTGTTHANLCLADTFISQILDGDNMPLFLVRCQLEVEGSPEVFEAFVKTCELCSGLQSSGKVKNFGAFADMSGGAVIVEAESEEEVRRFVESMPVKPFRQDRDQAASLAGGAQVDRVLRKTALTGAEGPSNPKQI